MPLPAKATPVCGNRHSEASGGAVSPPRRQGCLGLLNTATPVSRRCWWMFNGFAAPDGQPQKSMVANETAHNCSRLDAA
eukprot:15465264-Alexandrium_andersonii.AAC.1